MKFWKVIATITDQRRGAHNNIYLKKKNYPDISISQILNRVKKNTWHSR